MFIKRKFKFCGGGSTAYMCFEFSIYIIKKSFLQKWNTYNVLQLLRIQQIIKLRP